MTKQELINVVINVLQNNTDNRLTRELIQGIGVSLDSIIQEAPATETPQ